jgi:hypothetical protein
MKLPIVEVPLDKHRVRGMHPACRAPADIDQRAARRILDNEAVAIDFGDVAAHRNHTSRIGELCDRRRYGRCHLDRRSRQCHCASAASSAQHEQTRGTKADPFSAAETRCPIFTHSTSSSSVDGSGS